MKCSSGSCVSSCPDGICTSGETCEPDNCCSGVTVNFQTNNNNCGTCGVVCDPGEQCISGTCQTSPQCTVPADCLDDGNPCTTTACTGNVCYNNPNTNTCNDNNACTTPDTCNGAGTCIGTPRNCDDGNICTTDSCNPSTGCSYTNNNLQCGTKNCDSFDNLPCRDYQSVARYCSAGSCSDPVCNSYTNAPSTTQCGTKDCSYLNIFCRTYNSMTKYCDGSGTCGDPTCTSYTNTLDGTSCATNKICSLGSCVCNPSISCSPAGSYRCSGPSLQQCVLSGGCNIWQTSYSTCGQNANCITNSCQCSSGYGNCNNDFSDGCEKNLLIDFSNCGLCGKSCLYGENCINGVCSTCSKDTDCNDNNQCTTDACNLATGKCSNQNVQDNTLCNDNNLCTENDKCGSGYCSGTQKVCNDNNECTDDSCTQGTGNCAYANKPDGTSTQYIHVVCLSGLYGCTVNYYNIDNLYLGNGCEYYCVKTNNGVEKCDGIDNDCDKQTDETCTCTPDGLIHNCGPSVEKGECKFGTLTCAGGSWGACSGAVLLAAEICDGKDNDCDGIIDNGFPDNDKDGYSACRECNDNNAAIHPGAAEICDGLDNDCDGTRDGDNICSCGVLESLSKKVSAVIEQPADNTISYTGTSISFKAKEDSNAGGYVWDFGDSNVDSGMQKTHQYSAKGDYRVELKALNNLNPGCQDIKTITLHIKQCSNSSQCSQGYKCVNNECVSETTAITEQPFTITINSPTNQVYGQTTIPLIFSTSKPSQCSYSLNNGNLIAIQQTTKSITGKEGLNNLILKCSNASSSVQFTIKTKTEPESILQDLKGDGPGESLLSFAKEKGQEMKLTKEQAKDVISEVMEVSGLEITKSIEVSGSSSLVMLSIKNILPMTLENARIKITIPKTIAKTAAEIKAIDQFTVIDNDPMIQFILNMARNQQQTLTFEVDKVMDQAMLDQISIETEEDISSLLKKQQDTADAMKITKEFEEFEKDGETYTKITTNIKPKKGLKGFSLIEKIPKCLAKQIDYIKMDEKYKSMIKVINPDPIIMWQFQEITKEDTFSYEVKGVLSEECKNQIRSLGIADELGLDIEQTDYFRIILPLLLVPLLGIGFVYFHRFSERREKELEKENGGKEKPKAAKEEKKPAIEKKEEKDMGKFLDREIEEAEREFGKRMR